jgi:hypothetical protein
MSPKEEESSCIAAYPEWLLVYRVKRNWLICLTMIFALFESYGQGFLRQHQR